LTPPKSFQ